VVGPDTSAGKSKEIFGTSIKVKSRVLELLCPKGMTLEALERIIERCPDVLSLPGKTSAGTSGGDSLLLGTSLQVQFGILLLLGLENEDNLCATPSGRQG
jgi:hypothetical protein